MVAPVLATALPHSEAAAAACLAEQDTVEPQASK